MSTRRTNKRLGDLTGGVTHHSVKGGRRTKRAVIYLRVSTQRQANSGRNKLASEDKGFSITEQQEVCEAKAMQLDAEVIEVYIDEAESARVADRPDLLRMMERIKTLKDVDYVIVHKLDRFSRDRFDEAILQLELRKAGAKFISATENINGDTPGDRALHGFLALSADYYSANLGHEVMKGMRQKAKAGGTNGAARLGYLNIRQQVSYYSVATVVEDPERAPLIRWMFDAFATGEWTIKTMGAELRRRGLTTRETAKRPSHPIHDSQVHRILVNRYYLGFVEFEGVEYPGNHPKLVDEATFDKVQAILEARYLTGEKPQHHVHFLKSMLRCARCGGRFGITSPTNRHGTEYEYFYCLNRQKRGTCEQRYASVAAIEREVEQFWRTVRFPGLDLAALRTELSAKIEAEVGATSKQVPTQERRIAKLEQERKKLLQAFYADAIPAELLKEEQARITREVAEASKIIENHSMRAERAYQFLEDLLTLCDDPYALYLCADNAIRRMLNQAVAEWFWVWDERIHTVELTAEFTAVQEQALRLVVLNGADTAPALPQLSAETGSMGPDSAQAAPTYLRQVGPLCEPLSGYLRWETTKTNPRPVQGAKGSNLITLVGRLGLEPRTYGLKVRSSTN
jgi:site-specific DNA recombinase